MNKKLLAALALTLAAGGAMAQAEGPWMVRARAVHLDSANKGVAGLAINNKTIPEVDISYFVSPNIAAELILTVPQKQKVYLNGAQIGTLKHLPPTLTLQYHFMPTGAVRPYVGAGVNYTRFSSLDLPAGIGADKDSFGLALQAGVDFPVAKNVFLNVDVKKVQIRTDITAGGVGLGKFKVDPVLLGVGVGYRF